MSSFRSSFPFIHLLHTHIKPNIFSPCIMKQKSCGRVSACGQLCLNPCLQRVVLDSGAVLALIWPEVSISKNTCYTSGWCGNMQSY